MSLSRYFASLGVTAVALAWASPAFGADVAPPPPPVAPAVVGAPVSVGDAGCPTCQHGAPQGSCSTCGKSHAGILHKSKKEPFQVNLCPGACFGYFQTQWRKWDEVCPYPYLGTGVSDVPKPPVGVLNPKLPGTGLPAPTPVDPKTPPKMPDPKKVGSDVPPGVIPPIPMAPGKFQPGM